MRKADMSAIAQAAQEAAQADMAALQATHERELAHAVEAADAQLQV